MGRSVFCSVPQRVQKYRSHDHDPMKHVKIRASWSLEINFRARHAVRNRSGVSREVHHTT